MTRAVNDDVEYHGYPTAQVPGIAQPWARRRSGAFAAELLLPSEALFEDAGHLDSAAHQATFQRIMERYRVGARTAAFQLRNHGLLSSSQVRDDLIDRFSEVAG